MFFVFVRFLYATYWWFYSDRRYVRRTRRSLLICFVFKNFIMGHMPTSMRGLSDDEEANFLLVAPQAAAPPPIVPVGWLTLFGNICIWIMM